MKPILVSLQKFFKRKGGILIPVIIVLVITFVLLTPFSGKGSDEKAATAGALHSQASDQSPQPSETAQPDSTSSGPNVYYGVLEPTSRVEIIPEIRSQIIESPYEMGDCVNEGDLLIQMDDNGMVDNMATLENSLAKNDLALSANKESLANLTVVAPGDGILQKLSVREGERVNATRIGEIVNQDVMVARVPFNAEQIKQITPGNRANLVSARYMTAVGGTVTAVYQGKIVSDDGSVFYEVEIQTDQSCDMAEGTQVSAEIETDSGKLVSPAVGEMGYPEPIPVVSKGSGNALKVYIKNGQRIQKGQTVLEIENANLERNMKRVQLDRSDLEIRLRVAREDLAKCTICSPITGTVISKDHQMLDSISSLSDSIMTLADIRSLLFKVRMEEEDLQVVYQGMSVELTTVSDDPVKLTGIITSLSEDGHAVVTIHNTNHLMPGVQVCFTPPAQ